MSERIIHRGPVVPVLAGTIFRHQTASTSMRLTLVADRLAAAALEA